METTFGIMGNLSAAAKAAGVPDPIRIINLDEALRAYGDAVSFPSKVFYTPDEVKQIDTAKAAQARAAAMAAVTPQLVQGAQTLSKTDLGSGQNALGALLGGGGPNGPG
jgi:hypothetical protein